MNNPLRGRFSVSRSAIALGTAAAVFAGGMVVAPNASAQEVGAETVSSIEEGSSLVDLEVDTNPETGGEGSSNDQCIGTGLTVGLPLLLLVPVGLATQLGLAGTEAIAAQVGDAVRDANTALQNQLGVFNEDAARAVQDLDALLAPFGVTAAQAAIGLGMVAAGVAGSAALLDACGSDEGSSAMSSYWVGADASTTPTPTAPADSDEENAAEETTPAEPTDTEPTDAEPTPEDELENA